MLQKIEGRAHNAAGVRRLLTTVRREPVELDRLPASQHHLVSGSDRIGASGELLCQHARGARRQDEPLSHALAVVDDFEGCFLVDGRHESVDDLVFVLEAHHTIPNAAR